MKTQTLFPFVISTLIFACQKQNSLEFKPPTEQEEVLLYLKSKLKDNELKEIDLTTFSRIRSNGVVKAYRILAKRMEANGFYNVIVKKDADGIFHGFIQHVEAKIDENGREYGYNSIVILNERVEKKYVIENGYLRPSSSSQSLVTDVTHQIFPPNTIWINGRPYSLIPGGVIGGNSGGNNPSQSQLNQCEYIENPADPFGGQYGGGSEQELVLVELDDSADKTAIDIQKLFNCFNEISDYGATFKIKLNSDVPVNSFPSSATGFTGSPGHCFITITKSNNEQTVSKSFGFYPQSGKASLGLDPVPSKILNDSGHEINASIEISMNQTQFDLVKQMAIQKSSLGYDLDNNNCANYAIDIFNVVMPSPITVDKFLVELTGPMLPAVSVLIDKSPQMLFSKLQSMKTTGGTYSNNIVINTTNNYQSPSTPGECN